LFQSWAACWKRYLWIAHHRRYLVETAPPADLEVEQIFEVGEWEKLREDVSNWKSVGPGSVGVVQGIR
jgi:E3 ubiquitin-protein ligase KEG